MFGRKKKKEQEEAFKMLLEGMAKLHENPYDDAAFVNDEDYGYTSKKPIMTFRVPGSNQYLESLVTENGETITWNRVGSTSDPDIDGMIDIYEIFCNANKITTLYLNMYGVSNSKHTPKGFIFKGANKSGSNEVAPEIEQPQKPIEKKPEVINNHERNIPPTDNIEDAIKQLKKAIFMSKDPEGLWISLAELYVEKGEMQNARSALNKAQAVNSGQPDLEAAKQRILDKLESSTSTISNEPATQSAPAECLSLDAAKEAILKVAKQALSAINAENTALGAEEATKKQFAQDLIWYCAKRFRGFDQIKVHDEAVLSAFYGAISYTFSKDKDTDDNSVTIFEYLKNQIGIDQLERFANSSIHNTTDNEEEKKLRNSIYQFVTETHNVLGKVENDDEKQAALEYAVNIAFEMGVALSSIQTNSQVAISSDPSPDSFHSEAADESITPFDTVESIIKSNLSAYDKATKLKCLWEQKNVLLAALEYEKLMGDSQSSVTSENAAVGESSNNSQNTEELPLRLINNFCAQQCDSNRISFYHSMIENECGLDALSLKAIKNEIRAVRIDWNEGLNSIYGNAGLIDYRDKTVHIKEDDPPTFPVLSLEFDRYIWFLLIRQVERKFGFRARFLFEMAMDDTELIDWYEEIWNGAGIFRTRTSNYFALQSSEDFPALYSFVPATSANNENEYFAACHAIFSVASTILGRPVTLYEIITENNISSHAELVDQVKSHSLKCTEDAIRRFQNALTSSFVQERITNNACPVCGTPLKGLIKKKCTACGYEA